MIIFQKIRWMNFLSTGNAFTEISLNKNDSTVIIGENGSGKSTILDALCFVLFGKPFRKINKPQLMNSINKRDLLVEVEFSIGKNEYFVRRGMKPNVFEVYKNNEMLNQDGAVKDYQLEFEQNILKMNFKSFGQIVILGATFVPFMQLPAAHRREIIEDLLDIQIFSKMNSLLKDHITNNKLALQDVKYKIDLENAHIKSIEKNNQALEKLKTSNVNKITERIQTLTETNKKYSIEIEKLQAEIQEEQKKIKNQKSAHKKYNEMYRIKDNLLQKIAKLETDIHFYESNNECPVCKQEIDCDHKNTIIQSKQLKIVEVNDGVDKLKLEIDKILERLNSMETIQNHINDLNTQVNELNISFSINEKSIASLRQDLEESKKEYEIIDRGNTQQHVENITKYKTESKRLINERDTMGIVNNLLKDGGIKTQIIRKYVPIINKLINKYLAEMEFFVQFELDEQFNETIRSRFRDDFSYDSFSEGEKAKIDIALLFTWRAVSKLRNSISTNLCILDEVFDGSLDMDSTEYLMSLLQEQNGNLFIIIHNSAIQEKFENIIRFQKINNFSRIAS